jgi:hypothetical protein
MPAVVPFESVDNSLVARLAKGGRIGWKKLNSNILQLKGIEGALASGKVIKKK